MTREFKNLRQSLIQNYSRLRSLNFFLQYSALNSLGRLVPFVDVRRGNHNRRTLGLLLKEIDALLKQDAQNIADKIYPLSVLRPERLSAHARRVPKVFFDGLTIGLRRKMKRTKSFSEVNETLLKDLPEYYLRNFHYQTDGYLSAQSADLYEHQVELLFSGTADPMRRLLLRPAKEHLAAKRHLRFLELGCGTGTMTRFVRATFKEANITAVDLSRPYIASAQRKFRDIKRVQFQFADAAHLPFADGTFDFVYSVFMFHELPKDIRRAVIQESSRVLKSDGVMGFVDSLQLGDNTYFDHILKRFPQDFHEPFYADYVASPLNDIIAAERFKTISDGRGFLSKFGLYRKY